MKLKAEDRAYLAGRMMTLFDIKELSAFKIIDALDDFLQGRSRKILYELHYQIFKRDDPDYTSTLMEFLIEGFSYLDDQAKDCDEKKTLQKYMSLFFKFLFLQRCRYAKQVEAQSEATQHILKNVSTQLNTVLHTQERMIANLSHEMRTSLNTIYGYLTLLEKNDSLRGDEKFHLKKALNGAVSLQSLVKDILSITKLNSGQLEIEEDFFFLDGMLLQCIDHVAMEIKQHVNIAFEFSSSFVPFQVYGDQTHIMEIIINFLTNAFKYTQEGFVKLLVTYTPLKEGADVVFSVSDSGSGMTPEQVEDVFSPYSRYQREKQGLGLGLHITKQLAERMGGRLEVKSVEGEGTTFSYFHHFKKVKPINMTLENKQFCFYIEEKKFGTHIQEKIEYLRTCGATVQLFRKESTLINYLLSTPEKVPDIISILAVPEAYAKFDALIYYLRSEKRFEHTFFIAESMQQHLSLKYFDTLYEYCAPLYTYEEVMQKRHLFSEEGEDNSILSVLVIDDTETNLEIFKLFVEKKYPSATVDLAGGGYEGVGMCKVRTYDVIFLDLKMPGMDGFEVIKKLQELGGTLPPIYAFTADVYKSTYDKIYTYGFKGLMEKPLQPDTLYQILQKIKDAKSLNQ